MLRNSQTNAPGGQRPKPRFKIEKRRNRAPRFMRQLNSLDFSRFRKKNDIMRRPSVAFADYEIKDKRSSIMSSLLLLSALMEGVASFVLPIIDAFGPPKHVEHKFYFEVFQIIQFTASILALAYLQALMIYYDWKRQRREVLTQKLMRSSRDSSEEPYRTDEDRDNDSVVSVDPECSRTIEAPYQPVQIVENNVEISEDASSEVPPNADDEINQRNNSEITEEPQPSTSTESSSNGRNYNLQSRTVVIHDNDGDSSDETIVRKCSSESVSPKPLGKRRVTHLGRMFGDTLGTFSKSNPPFTQDNEGINLYLRLGAVVFGFGVMIMDGFRVADQFRAEKIIFACHSVLWIPVNLIHSVYVFWQTYFLFKYHRVVFNVQKFFIRFILSHMAVVNLGQWLSTVVQEVMVPPEEELEPKGGISATTLAPSMVTSLITHQPVFTDGNASLLQQMDTSKKNLSAFGEPKCHTQETVFVHYLIPCGVEYSLIAGAIFYKMFQRIGHVGHRNDRRKPGIIEKHGSRILPRDNPSECHRAHKGLFVGLLLFLATLVVLALFYIFMRSHNYSGAITLYQASYITLFSVGIVAASIALYQLRVLSLRELSEEDAFDDNLLLIGLLGMLFYDMFLLVPAVEAKGENSTAGSMFVGKAIIEMVQALLQVFLILEGSRRQAATVNHMARKPGRTIITFLLILNLAMWIFNTFGLKYAENHSIYRSYYTGIAWKIITHLSLPLIIFFRFHSTVCLADIWTNAYRMHSCASV